MAILNTWLNSKVSTYLEFPEVCSLEVVAASISAGFADWEGIPYAWQTAASYAGLSVVGLDKDAIKSVFAAVWKHDLRPKIISVNDSKSAMALMKASRQIDSMTKRLTSRTILRPFITSIQFSDTDIQKYLSDPAQSALSSNPFRVALGNDSIKIAFHWHEDAMVLSSEMSKNAVEPMVVHIHTVLSPLIMRMSFTTLSRPQDHYHGKGLCCMLQAPKAFADSMKEGILCMGVVYSLSIAPDTPEPHRTRSLVSALSIDAGLAFC
jgi:hypothetical protein